MPPSFHNTDSCWVLRASSFFSFHIFFHSPPQNSILPTLNLNVVPSCSFLHPSPSLPPPPSPVPSPSPSPYSIPTLLKINASHRPPHAPLHQIVSPRPIYYLTTLPGLTHRLGIPTTSRFSSPSPPATSATHHPPLGIPLNPLSSSFHESLSSTPHQLHHTPLPTKLTHHPTC